MARTVTTRMAAPLPTRDEHEREGSSSRRVLSGPGAYRICTKGLPRLGEPVPCTSRQLPCGPGRKAHRRKSITPKLARGRCPAMHAGPGKPLLRSRVAADTVPPSPGKFGRPETRSPSPRTLARKACGTSTCAKAPSSEARSAGTRWQHARQRSNVAGPTRIRVSNPTSTSTVLSIQRRRIPDSLLCWFG